VGTVGPPHHPKEVNQVTSIPKDPAMLLSYINTQLRDFYPAIEELCNALAIERDELDAKLSSIDYQYDRDKNQYV